MKNTLIAGLLVTFSVSANAHNDITYTLQHDKIGNIPSLQTTNTCIIAFKGILDIKKIEEKTALCVGTDGSVKEITCQQTFKTPPSIYRCRYK